MSQQEELVRFIHIEIEHFQGIAFGGDKIAVLMALSRYVQWTSYLLPPSEDVRWLSEELDNAITRFRTGEVRTLGEAFGVPDRRHRKITALQNQNSSVRCDYDRETVARFVYANRDQLEACDERTFEQLGHAAGTPPGNDLAARVRARRRGCAVYLLHDCPTATRYGAAVAIWRRLVADKELHKFVRGVFANSGFNAVGAIIGVSGSLVRKWYYEARQLDLYWTVLYSVITQRLSWDIAFREAAEKGKMTEEQAREWFDKGKALAHTPN